MRTVLTVGLGAQGVLTAPVLLLGTSRASLAILLPALFIAFFGHVTAIVAYMVTATSGLPNSEQGLATGLATLAQQIAITVGIPILAAGVEVVVMLVGVALIWTGLRSRPAAISALSERDPDVTAGVGASACDQSSAGWG